MYADACENALTGFDAAVVPYTHIIIIIILCTIIKVETINIAFIPVYTYIYKFVKPSIPTRRCSIFSLA